MVMFPAMYKSQRVRDSILADVDILKDRAQRLILFKEDSLLLVVALLAPEIIHILLKIQ